VAGLRRRAPRGALGGRPRHRGRGRAADVAEDVGLDPKEIRSAVADEAWHERLEAQFAEAREAGVTGVPTFAYDGYAARGAVPPAQLRRLVEGTE